jgi:hypothetical protein
MLRFPLILFWLIVMPVVYAQTKGVVEGKLIVQTDPSIIARDVDLEVIELGGGMSTIRTAKTDSAGRFRIEGLPENQMVMIRASYKGAKYNSHVRFDSAGKAYVEISVFEPTDSMKDIQVEEAQLVFEMAGDQLKVTETFIFNNKTLPPRTYIHPESTFRFSKPPGLLAPPQMSIAASRSSMPLIQAAQESADGKSYYSLYPMRPGVTAFEVQEMLPYTNRNFTYAGKFYHDINALSIVAIPQDLTVSGKGLGEKETDSKNNAARYASPPVKAGTELTLTLSGGTPIPESESTEAASNSTIQTVANDISRYALIIGPLLLMAFILALWYAFNRSRNGSLPAANFNTRQLREQRERLLNSIAEMDHRHETNPVGGQELLKQRAEHKLELRRILLLLKKK